MRLTDLLKKVVYSSTIFFNIIFLFASISFAEKYYVSPSGTATWSQCTSITTPCSAITAMQNAQAGDVVYFRGGTYNAPYKASAGGYNAAYEPTNSGVADSPITFIAYTGEIPYINNSANAGQTASLASFGANHTNYIIWDGFHTQSVGDSGSRAKGAILKNSDHSIIRNCDITGLSNGLSNNDVIRIESSDHVVIENNKLHGSHGSDVNSAGLKVYYLQHFTARNNTIYDNDTAVYDKRGTSFSIYHHNYVYDVDTCFYICCSDDKTYTSKVYQNVIDVNGTPSGWATALHAGGISSSCDGMTFLFYNNTIINNSSRGFSEKVGLDISSESFNNIFYTNSWAILYYTGGTDYSDYNIYYNVDELKRDDNTYYSLSAWQSATGWDANSHINNPSFVNPGGTSPEDYKRTSYPADGRGGSYPSVRGAYITGNEVIGYSSDGGKPLPPPDIVEPQDFQREPSQ